MQEEVKEKEIRSTDTRALYNKIKPHLDYSIEYAEDRVKQIKECWDEELYVDCVSSKYFRKKQVKTTDDELSEADKTLTDHLDRIANYILYSSFDNEEERQEYEELKKEKKSTKEIKDKNERIKKELEIREKQKNRLSLLSNSRKSQTNYSTLNEEDIQESHENFEITEGEENKTFYHFKDKELNQKGTFNNSLRYWEHYGQHNNTTIPSMFDSVDHNLKFYQVAFESLEEKKKGIEKLERKLEKRLSVEERGETEKLLRENRAEYNFMAERFRDRVVLSLKTPTKKRDTMLDIENDISYTDTGTVKILLYNFKEFKDKYDDKTSTTLWCIVKDMERITQKVKLSSTQLTIMQKIMRTRDWSYKELQDEVRFFHNKEIGVGAIKYHIDTIIRKIVEYNREKEEKHE